MGEQDVALLILLVLIPVWWIAGSMSKIAKKTAVTVVMRGRSEPVEIKGSHNNVDIVTVVERQP